MNKKINFKYLDLGINGRFSHLLNDIYRTIRNKIELLKKSKLFPHIDINICNMIDKLQFREINMNKDDNVSKARFSCN